MSCVPKVDRFFNFFFKPCSYLHLIRLLSVPFCETVWMGQGPTTICVELSKCLIMRGYGQCKIEIKILYG